MLLGAVKDYLVNSTFHGLRFIAEDERHWTERIFWLVCCILSWFGSAKLIEASWDGFQHNAISFVVETTNLNVETSFPSISVCEIGNHERLREKIKETYNESYEYNLEEIYKEIVYFDGTVYFIKHFCNSKLKCPTKNYKKLAEETRSVCEKTFKTCKWTNIQFDCCSHFQPLRTEYGVCYSLNARNEIPTKHDFLKLKSSTQLGLGKLLIELMVPAKVYIHTETDIPYYNTMTTDIVTANYGEHTKIGISMTDTENEPEVRQLSVSQRNCRFPDENYLTVSQRYSYSACVVQCRLTEQLKRCNCTSHLMPYTDESQHCDMAGILCLTREADSLSILKTPWSDKEGLDCSCLQGCEEPEFHIIETSQQQEELNINQQNVSTTEIRMFRHPSHRYKRNVVRGQMDLVVSMGGTAGLFVGASLLSFAEFVYFFTLRLYNNKTMLKEKLPNNSR